ncbi:MULTISPECIES: hypothetical protein [unclassified Streptomyces]|uniref:hypothetical protein n=1 Tax=unclassified Streptomyces TaxID=2593676 RepID=UPI002DDC10EC|nr:hypothetical protein [Streptomyces sp. NBC_01795]WSA97777.1 hypothetical protein OIE63_40535 [Streptomyces sp. NBC_01795]WSS46706.1 hypothetical protein OG220_39685 [Streptomyces sp. NBC_01187]WSS47077.1 hypothetical protein OG220_41940 [Streptomyces sp. NBC_01187]
MHSNGPAQTIPEQNEVLVFIASRHTRTTHRRVLWRVSQRDAMRICSDPRTSNSRHMLCWTAAEIDDPELNRYVPDTGAYGQVLLDHGVTVLRSHRSRTTAPDATG